MDREVETFVSLGVFVKLRNATVSFIVSIRQSA